jgi:HK97 family phage major capsid protein/HK97 family phage prohead protease
MSKASSIFKIKSFDETQGVFIGIASTPAPDRANDIVDPAGAVFSLPLPLLAFHNHEKVIGTVEQINVTKDGLEVVCRVLKDVTQDAAEIWGLIQNGAMKGLSIGFKSIDKKQLSNGGFHFTKYELLELSVVPVAMNGQAMITATKSAATQFSLKGNEHMTISEQIQQFEAKKAGALAKMDALITKGATLDERDEAQYKSAEAEVASIAGHIDRLKAAEDRQAKNAVPVLLSGARSVEVVDNAQKGTDFVRFTKSLALSRGNPMQAYEIAKNMKAGDRVETVLKAAIGAGSTTSADFTSLLAQQTMANEFIELLRPQTILGKLSPRAVPSNITIPRALSGTSASWLGEGKAAPLTNAAFNDMKIGEHKIGAIAVFTEELLRRSEPSAEALVRDDLLATVATFVDLAFIDAANAGIADVKPAAITNGASSTAASGTTAAAVRADVATAYKKFIVANHPLDSGVWIMHPSTALSLSMMRNVNGAKEFEGISMNGGTLEGLPVVTSTSVPGDAVAGYSVVLAVQNDIFVAEGGLTIDASREASLEMETAPTTSAKTPTSAQLVSLWQTGGVAIKAIRGITWTRRRPTAVAVISAAKY